MMNHEKKVGLALSGGAARGFAHLGVLKVLVEHKIPIDFIAGTSAGSFSGGAFASGLSVEEIANLGRDSGWLKLGKFAFSAKGLLTNAPMGEIIKAKFPHQTFEDLQGYCGKPKQNSGCSVKSSQITKKRIAPRNSSFS